MELEPSERDRADLAALADGSLPEQRRPEVEARVAASPPLQEALARQRSALAEIAAVSDVRAPEGLRAWLEEQATPQQGAPAGSSRRMRWVGRLAAVGVAAAVALAVVLSLGSSPADDLAQATADARPAAFGPNKVVHVYVDELAFPAGDPWPWNPTGSAMIEVDGQGGAVVAYEKDGAKLDYAIVARPALDLPGGEGRYRSFTYEGRPAVMWHREGRTCLLLGDERTGTDELVRLAKATTYY